MYPVQLHSSRQQVVVKHLARRSDGMNIARALALAIVFRIACAATLPAQAQTLSTLYSFAGDPDGALPFAGLVRDAAGNLYGTTSSGGTNHGTVFVVSSQRVETILHTFRVKSKGSNPNAGVVRDAQGNLYGTTAYGGAYNFGTVFKITKMGKQRTLHSFAGTDGANPFAPLILDSAGNLYGTTAYGGAGSCTGGGGQSGCGTVFILSPSGAETVLYSFAGGTDGAFPSSGLVRDAEGNFYGTTPQGGGCVASQGCGTVFTLSNAGVETVLHRFAGDSTDGSVPTGLIIGPGGNLFGTTVEAGAYGFGTVYELTPTGTEKLLYSFGGVANDGTNPPAGLVWDRAENFYGTTQMGGGPGCLSGCGTIFKITKAGVETVVYAFGANGTGGFIPFAGLIRDAAGNLYGTTGEGGTSGLGTVFELTP
jgi:uncharacterized repeat protein (TIGR03803 family)